MSFKIKIGLWGFMLDDKIYTINSSIPNESIKADIIMDGKNVTINDNIFIPVLNKFNIDGSIIIVFSYNNQLIIGEYDYNCNDITFYNIDEEEINIDIIPVNIELKAIDFCQSNCNDKYKFF